MQWVIYIAYVISSVVGLTLFKMGSKAASMSYREGLLSAQIGIISIVGMLLYVMSFFLNLQLILRYNLSYIIPISVAGVYLLTYLSSIIIFNDKVSAINVLGSAFILFGVVLISLKK